MFPACNEVFSGGQICQCGISASMSETEMSDTNSILTGLMV